MFNGIQRFTDGNLTGSWRLISEIRMLIYIRVDSKYFDSGLTATEVNQMVTVGGFGPVWKKRNQSVLIMVLSLAARARG